MIGRAAVDERVREWGLREDIIEKDYVLGWVLWGIGSDPQLATAWVFKGGTCLKKCYLETYRFSEDLDFTVVPGGPVLPEAVEPVLRRMLVRAGEESGIDFAARPPTLRARPSGRAAEGRIYYRGPRGAPGPASVKLDLSVGETVVRPTVLRAIAHPYDDRLPPPAQVRCYSFEEIFAEKIRAMGERCRPRDLYDIVSLFRRRDLRAVPELIRTVLWEKCAAKGLSVPTVQALETSPYRTELESEWANMLAHQLPALPPFAQFWEELPGLFAWLEGTAAPEELPPAPAAAEEDAAWRPPPTVWVWGAGVPLETIRFAAANHLCVELTYLGTARVIEPYSLRRTRDGYLLLHATKVDTREHRSYRVDRIQAIRVTTRAFRPVYAVEFAQVGPISAPPSPPRAETPSAARPWGRLGSSMRGGTTYVIACAVCGKRFERARYDTRLRPHKNRDGRDCYGRHGSVVNTRYR